MILALAEPRLAAQSLDWPLRASIGRSEPQIQDSEVRLGAWIQDSEHGLGAGARYSTSSRSPVQYS